MHRFINCGDLSTLKPPPMALGTLHLLSSPLFTSIGAHTRTNLSVLHCSCIVQPSLLPNTSTLRQIIPPKATPPGFYRFLEKRCRAGRETARRRRGGGGKNDPRPPEKLLATSYTGKHRFFPSLPPPTLPPHTRVWQWEGNSRRGTCLGTRATGSLPAYRPAPTLLVLGEEGCFSVPLGNQALHLWRRGLPIEGGERARALPPALAACARRHMPGGLTPLHSLAPAPERPRPRGFLPRQPRPPCLLPPEVRGRSSPAARVGIRPPWIATTAPVPPLTVLKPGRSPRPFTFLPPPPAPPPPGQSHCCRRLHAGASQPRSSSTPPPPIPGLPPPAGPPTASAS